MNSKPLIYRDCMKCVWLRAFGSHWMIWESNKSKHARSEAVTAYKRLEAKLYADVIKGARDEQ